MSYVQTAEGSRAPKAADHRRRVFPVALVVALGLAALPSVATADDFSPNQPALDQYVESLPVAEGNHAPSRHKRSQRLPRSTARALSRSADGRVLEQLATSPASGAPTTEATQRQSGSGGGQGGGHAQAGEGSPTRPIVAGQAGSGSLASAAVDTAGGGPGLLLLVLLGTIGVAAIFARSRTGQGR